MTKHSYSTLWTGNLPTSLQLRRATASAFGQTASLSGSSGSAVFAFSTMCCPMSNLSKLSRSVTRRVAACFYTARNLNYEDDRSYKALQGLESIVRRGAPREPDL